MENNRNSDVSHEGHRERLTDLINNSGIDCVSTVQAVEFFLTYIFPRGDVNPLAHRLLDRFENFGNIVDACESDLKSVKGINDRSAKKIKLFSELIFYYSSSKMSKKISSNNNHKLDYIYNFTVKKVTSDFENLQFNTAISQMMIFINEVYKQDEIYVEYLKDFVKMFSCICPFVGEEIWNSFGNADLITYEKWPTYKEEALKLQTKTIAVQVIGKLRGTIEIGINEDEASVKEKALQIEGKNIVKIIYVPNKIVNIVVK